MRNVYVILLLMFLNTGIQAQRPGGGGRPDFSNMPAEGILTGKIVDAMSGNLMEYANVVLFSLRDSSMVSGAVSGVDGIFRMEKVPYGRFYLVANFIGFNKTTIDDIMITPRQKAVDIGEVKLQPATASLEAVEISAQKEHIEYKIDKKVVNVDQDIMAQGGTAVTALENTPSVQVDIDGNVSLRGSSNFTVLVDGRPSVLGGTDALQQIPAGNIDRIEIITNPSAKYDPDGVAGILNVILKEKREKGFNGIVNAAAGNYNMYNGNFLLNYRTGKFNFFGGMDYRDHNHGGERKSEQDTYYNDTTESRNSFGDRSRGRKGYGVRFGTDYYLSDMTTIGVLGRVGNYGFNGGGTSNLHVFTNPATNDQYSRTVNNTNRDGDYYSGTINFQHKFDDFGHQIEAMAFYKERSGDDTEDQEEYTTDENWNTIDDEPYLIRTLEKSNDQELRIKADYAKPIGEEGKVEAGFQSRFETEIEDYYFYDWDYPGSDWIINPVYTNKMDFRRDIHSVYGIYSNTWKSFGYQFGLRSEYTYREIKNEQSTEPSLIDRWDYFPTIHTSKSFKNKDQVLASYTRRIDRPRGWYLDPFISYMDAYNYRQGNPNLKPEYIDSWELGYQKRIFESLISLEGYYRIVNNKITRIRTLQEDGKFLHTFQNLNKDYSLGMELMINTQPVKWFNLNLTGNLYNYRLEGNVADEEVDTESTNWNGRLNAVFKLPKEFSFQLNGMYYGPSVTAQGESEGFFMTNLALKKEFFENHLSLTFSVRDLFSTGKHDFTSSGTGFYSHDYFDRDAPIVSLNLSWRISDYNRQMDRNGNGNGAEPDMESDF